jgi:hypothetical protein
MVSLYSRSNWCLCDNSDCKITCSINEFKHTLSFLSYAFAQPLIIYSLLIFIFFSFSFLFLFFFLLIIPSSLIRFNYKTMAHLILIILNRNPDVRKKYSGKGKQTGGLYLLIISYYLLFSS